MPWAVRNHPSAGLQANTRPCHKSSSMHLGYQRELCPESPPHQGFDQQQPAGQLPCQQSSTQGPEQNRLVVPPHSHQDQGYSWWHKRRYCCCQLVHALQWYNKGRRAAGCWDLGSSPQVRGCSRLDLYAGEQAHLSCKLLAQSAFRAIDKTLHVGHNTSSTRPALLVTNAV